MGRSSFKVIWNSIWMPAPARAGYKASVLAQWQIRMEPLRRW
jgi:hypothetical protein